MTTGANSLLAGWPAADAAAGCPSGWHWLPCIKRITVSDNNNNNIITFQLMMS